MNRNRLRLTRAVLLLVPAYDRTIDPTTGPTRTFPLRSHPPPPHRISEIPLSPSSSRAHPLASPLPFYRLHSGLVREAHSERMIRGPVTRPGLRSPPEFRYFDDRSSPLLLVEQLLFGDSIEPRFNYLARFVWLPRRNGPANKFGNSPAGIPF